MAVATVHRLHGIDTDEGFISQIVSSTPSPGIETLISRASGVAHTMFVANMQQRPQLGFESTQIKSLLDICGVSGLADLSADNTDIYYKKMVHLASREADASTVHYRLRAAQAGLVLQSITASQGGQATASCRLIFPFDGTNEPIVPAGSQALVGTPTDLEHYTVGPVYINGVKVNGIQDLTVDFGAALDELGGDGELYDTFAAIATLDPVITFSTPDLSWATLGLNGLAVTSLSVYLRKIATTGRVANGTAEHIKFSATAGYAYIEETPAGGTERQMSRVRVVPSSPDADLPLAVNTAIAITT